MRLRIKDFTTKVGSGVTPKGGAEVYLTSGIPLFRSQNVTDDGFLLDDIAYISQEIDNMMQGSRVKANDVLLNITGASIGRCYYTPSTFKGGNVNQHVCIIRPKKNSVLPKYLHYCLISPMGKELIKLSQNGANREGLTIENIKNFAFNIPSITEQYKIITYLDKKVKNINSQITLLTKKQENYQRLKKSLINRMVCHGLNPNAEMKDSDIMWIGEIPQNWGILRLKDLYKESKEVSTTGKEPLLSVSEYYGVAKKSDKMGEDEVFESRAESLVGYKICHKGDLVVNIMLAWKKGLGTSNYEGIVSPAYAVYKPHNICPSYYHYLLRSEQAITEFKRYSKGIIDSRLRLYTDRFYNIKAPYPPLAEQEAIANYLDDKCSKIDTIVEKISEEINLLGKLKKSLINEVITGKRNV